MFDEGYDSDGEMGSFFDQVLMEGALIIEEEEIIGEECAPDAPQDATRDESENNEAPQEDTQDASNEASADDISPTAPA